MQQYTIKELAKLLNKTENNLRVLIHKHNILPVTESKPFRYSLESFKNRNANSLKINELRNENLILKARITELEKLNRQLLEQNALIAKYRNTCPNCHTVH